MELPVPRLEPSPRWVRVRAGDQWVADSRRARITGLICFFNERVDLTIDGVLEAGPDTPMVLTNMDRLEAIVARLPEAERVDIAEWGDHPTFRVNGKNFVFCDRAAHDLSLKLSKEEAAAVVATDPAVNPSGYGLGRHGWIAFSVDEGAGEERWRQIDEWVRTSYTLVAPKRLAKLVDP